MRGARTTTIYLVRHGEVHNPTGIIYGRLPRFGLSRDGLEQARHASSALAGDRLATIYCSPQLRARQTAAAIRTLQPAAQLRVSILLSEVRTSWQGQLPPANARLFDFYDAGRAHGDETIDAIALRMRGLLTRILRQHRGDKVACVSHGDPIAIALADLAGAPLTLESLRQRGYPRLASVTALEFDSLGEQAVIRLIHPASSR